jgi:hypothetical protein
MNGVIQGQWLKMVIYRSIKLCLKNLFLTKLAQKTIGYLLVKTDWNKIV